MAGSIFLVVMAGCGSDQVESEECL